MKTELVCYYLDVLTSSTGYMDPGSSSQGHGFGVQEMDPGSMGQIVAGVPAAYGDGDGYGQGAFEDEPPLLQELGIDFELIKQKVSSCTLCVYVFVCLFVCVCVCVCVCCMYICMCIGTSVVGKWNEVHFVDAFFVVVYCGVHHQLLDAVLLGRVQTFIHVVSLM